jgi:hypothetical protein
MEVLMRRIFGAAIVASVLLTAGPSAAQTPYLFHVFTFDPATRTLVGTYGDPFGDTFATVTLVVDASTTFEKVEPVPLSNPHYGLFNAWNAALTSKRRDGVPGLLVALGVDGASALVTPTFDGSGVIATLRPTVGTPCTSEADCGGGTLLFCDLKSGTCESRTGHSQGSGGGDSP